MENTRDITKKCTQGDRSPLVSIVLAVYNPNLNWLEEQLQSINMQTYRNIELLVMDDCSSIVSTQEIENLLKQTIKKFEFRFFPKRKNEGSNKTFERLTELAGGEYISYCDQDDIWDKFKIEKLISVIKNENSVLAYSDMRIIDEKSVVTADSLKKIRPRLRYLEGTNMLNYMIFANCIAGCSMIVKSTIAKKSIPFHEETVCDQWISIFASNKNRISFLEEQLVNYRQHGNNQTGILDGVYDKSSYYSQRLEPVLSRIEILKNKFDLSDSVLEFGESRRKKNIKGILKNRSLSKKDAYFDVAMILLPDFIIKILIYVIKRKRD